MGDRANIAVHDTGYGSDNRPVYLYSHWGGDSLLGVLAEALDSPQGRGRWSDPSYLCRIIFCHMIKDDVMGETGYGIGTSPPDQNHPHVHVFPSTQKIVYGDDEYTFDSFITWRKGLAAAAF